jgi:hypothetical protein
MKYNMSCVPFICIKLHILNFYAHEISLKMKNQSRKHVT